MICTCLDQMIEEGFDAWDADTVTRATGFRSVLHSGSFLVSFVTAKKGLQCAKPLTIKLQSKSKDVCNAHANITEVKTCIAELRENAKNTFSVWFEEAIQMASSVGEEIQLPRHCSRQTLRDNHPASTAEHFYRASVGVAFLEYLLVQMN